MTNAIFFLQQKEIFMTINKEKQPLDSIILSSILKRPSDKRNILIEINSKFKAPFFFNKPALLMFNIFCFNELAI